MGGLERGWRGARIAKGSQNFYSGFNQHKGGGLNPVIVL